MLRLCVCTLRMLHMCVVRARACGVYVCACVASLRMLHALHVVAACGVHWCGCSVRCVGVRGGVWVCMCCARGVRVMLVV